MLSLTLFKRELKASYKIFLIIFAVLMMYTGIIIGMFEPKLSEMLEQFTQVMPELMNAFGMGSKGITLIEFLSTYLYGFLFLVFPMIFEIILANRLVARYVDQGSMAYLLASPLKRVKIILTQTIVMWTSIGTLIMLVTIGEIGFAQLMFPGELDIVILFKMNIGLYVLHLAISGICFLVSCISNDVKLSYSIGSGIPILFFLIQMLSNVGKKLEVFKYFTIFSLYPSSQIASGEKNAYGFMSLLLIIAFVLYGLGGYVFTKRDLSV